MTMKHAPFSLSDWVTRTGVAVGTAAVLLTGAAWQMSAETSTPTTASAAQTTPQITRPIAGGRDSYADIVKVVAPAVVTIRTEGRAIAGPAQFRMPNDDFFRRFFGDPDTQPGPQRLPRAPRQRGLG